CFCFTSQEFAANEERELLVRFIVDSDLPSYVDTITLSYTFFDTARLTDTARRQNIPPIPISKFRKSQMSSHAEDPYFVPHGSHWPAVGSVGLLVLMVGVSSWFNGADAGFWVMLTGA